MANNYSSTFYIAGGIGAAAAVALVFPSAPATLGYTLLGQTVGVVIANDNNTHPVIQKIARIATIITSVAVAVVAVKISSWCLPVVLVGVVIGTRVERALCALMKKIQQIAQIALLRQLVQDAGIEIEENI